MEIDRAIRFIWDDEEWVKKILIAAALMLSGIGNIGLVGWMAELARRVANDEENPLPEWDDIGKYFMIGLKYMGVTFIWSLPVILLIVFSSLLTILAASADDSGAIIAIVSISSICIYAFVFVYILILSLMIMPLWVQMAEDTPFGTLINPANSWKLLRANVGGYLIAVLISWLGMMAASLGTIACAIGVFFTSAIAQAIFAHLAGQATGQARLNLENQPAVPVVD
jgi:hypothetical protein